MKLISLETLSYFLDKLNTKFEQKIPTKNSQLENDNGYLTNETLPVSDWAKEETKPSYTYDELNNKPFGNVHSIEKVVIPETTITLTGEKNHKCKAYAYEDSELYGEKILTSSEIPYREFIYVTLDGVRYLAKFDTKTMMDDEEIYWTEIDGERFGIGKYYNFGIKSYEYIIYCDNLVGEHTIKIEDLATTTVELDERFIPETIARTYQVNEKANKEHIHSWDDLEDKPFYEEISREIFLEETSIEIDSSLFKKVSSTSHFTEGDTYLVTYNGVEYECVAYPSIYYNVPTILIGNATLIGLAGGNNEPFCFDSYISDNTTYFTAPSAGTYTISITRYNSVVHKKIDDKFVNAAGQKVSGNSYIIDEEIKVAESGAEIFNDYINNINVGTYSHVEGFNNINNKGYAHVEGFNNIGNGWHSHVEGRYNKANNSTTHVEGMNNIASSPYQHVQGMSNVEDLDGKYLHIIGNGFCQMHATTGEITKEERSNAHTVDWDGNAWYSGDVYTGGDSQDDKNAKKLATESYVDDSIGSFSGTVEITSDYPVKENTVLTIDPGAEEVNIYTAEEVDEKIAVLNNFIVETFEELKKLISNNETDKAVAFLDNAILDLSTLA